MKKIYLLILIISFQTALGQQLPLLSQYVFNKYPFNPAVAGSDDRFVFLTGYRSQWLGFDGAPQTASFTMHGPLGRGSCIGADVYNDKLGATSELGFHVTYAYQIQINNDSRLAFGLQSGTTQYAIDGSLLTTYEPNDQVVPLNTSSALIADASFGTYLFSKNYFAGASVQHLAGSSVLFKNDFPKDQIGLLRNHLVLLGGLKIATGDKLAVEPSFMLRAVTGAPIQIDFSSRLIYDEKYWFGLTYRTRAAWVVMVGLDISDHFVMGYAFDYATTELQSFTDGTHEIIIGWKLNKKKPANNFM
jgi:type IX secretion system PorP/SprF family membrane protein